MAPATAICILLVIFSILTVWYVAGAVMAPKEVLVSTLATAGKTASADMLYYLPTADLNVKATVTAIISKTGNAVSGIKATELAFETATHIVPDTSALYLVSYTPSIFANDDIKLNVGPDGLLQSVSATTEDRFSGIVSLLAESPAKLLALSAKPMPEGVAELPATVMTEVTYKHDFTFTADELAAGTATRSWEINPVNDGSINDKLLDASFTVKFRGGGNKIPQAGESGNGLFVRVLKTITVNIQPTGPQFTGEPLQYTTQLPDRSSLILIPVSRSAFVKKINAPKFTNGMLTEQVINKPSEAEGFVSIPVAIGKALVSIPAQLLQFSVNRDTSALKAQQNLLTQQKALLDAQAALATAQAAAAKGPAPADAAKKPA